MSVFGVRFEGDSTYELQRPQHSIDMPSLIGSKSFSSKRYLSGHPCLELVVCDFEEGKELSNKYADILLVDECV